MESISLARKDKFHWREYDDERDEHLDKFAKMRQRKSKSSKAAHLAESFVCPETQWQELALEDSFPARVLEVHKRYCFVAPEHQVGEVTSKDIRLATVARKFLQAEREDRNFVVVGDRVLCTPTTEDLAGVSSELPQCVVQKLAPRQAVISRADPSREGMRHVLASNMDQLVIVASFLSPLVKWGLIDRYLVLAETENIPAHIVLNKKDLLLADGNREFISACEERSERYRQLGYQVWWVQASGKGAAKAPEWRDIGALLKGKISLLSGHSGVGKSSIINLYHPELIQDVEPNSEIFYKGRHTTTFASFLRLKGGGYVIDTPGIRSFVLQEFPAQTLAQGFREFVPFLGKCAFRQCRHIEEPDCAIKEAVESGVISDYRYRSYQGILLGTTGREGRTQRERPTFEFDEDDYQ